jgi:hypothetical protein
MILIVMILPSGVQSNGTLIIDYSTAVIAHGRYAIHTVYGREGYAQTIVGLNPYVILYGKGAALYNQYLHQSFLL